MPQSTPPQIKAVIFDFDGTIADSFPVFVHAVAYALNRKPFTAKEIEDLRQHSAREVIKILKIKPWRWPLLYAKGTREIDRHQGDITIFPGMTETLKTLHRQGHKLYIVSSHSGKGIALFLERYGLEDVFDHTYSSVGLFGKPKALKKLQARFGYDNDECLFVGDEVRDIEAAKKANMPCIAVSCGFNAAASLKEHGPTTLIDKPGELTKILLGS